LHEIAVESLMRHQAAFAKQPDANRDMDRGSEYAWRRDGELHLMSPEVIALLQHAVRSGDREIFKRYSRLVDDQSERLYTLRGLFKLKNLNQPIPLDEVEPVSAIVRRFCTGAMSLGSISTEAHETLAIAMNRLGGRSNTGEGGEDPRRFAPDANGDLRRSAIKQVASGRFGVTPHYLVNADELQIKIAQGAKPGEGGQLPGHKVSEYIGQLRYSVPGVTLISPPPHHDIYSIEDLAQLIFDLKNCNPQADITVKLVSEVGVGTVAAGVSKGHAERVIIAGYDGGTGASPISSIKHAGVPWEIGLAETQQTLVLNDLRGRIIVQTDGQLRTARDVVIAAMLGAEEFAFATVALITVGCIMMRKCHLNTCPVGVATQDEGLRAKFNGKPEHVVNYFTFLAEGVRELLAQLGVRYLDELIGQTQFLEMDEAIKHWKNQGLDYSLILAKPTVGPEIAIRRVHGQEHGLDKQLDIRLIEMAAPALERREAVRIEMPIRNSNRTVGTMLSGQVALRHGLEGLPEGTIGITLTGIAGQSLGAFLAPGIDLRLIGEANDYVGKGMAGGRIIIHPDPEAPFVWHENSIVGNTVLYGATGGEVYFAGRAGERFCVRNSGVTAVIEGVGDHGCEYMTGGRMVCLGRTGRNFAAGMSGGFAYVLDDDNRFRRRCNPSMVDIEQMTAEDEDARWLKQVITKHYELTRSPRAAEILATWDEYLARFVRVFPHEYRRVLAERAAKVEQEKEAAHG
jgi:glutamate synthase domain-containing protein 2/glutamate synthase domain-containing protein 3